MPSSHRTAASRADYKPSSPLTIRLPRAELSEESDDEWEFLEPEPGDAIWDPVPFEHDDLDDGPEPGDFWPESDDGPDD